jgi:EmrB/QacA subfamily drug resistance transporter
MTLAHLSRKEIILVMLGVMLGVLLASLDSSVVGTAMPKIISDLNGMGQYSWPFTAYMLCSTIIIPISGKMADSYGRKLIYLSGIIIFLIASALCGISQTMMQLIIFRGAQGLGGGIILSSAFAIVGELFSPRERGKYMGFVASMFGLSSLLGPTLGGFLTESSVLGWRWIFYINIPLGIIALLTVFFALPSVGEDLEKKRIDYPGLIIFILAIIPFLLAFTWAGNDYAWYSPQIIGMFAFSITGFIIFYFIEQKADNPIIPLGLFSNRIFNISIGAMFMSSVTMFGILIFLPLFVQTVLNKSASGSGMVITPLMLSFVVSAIIGGRVISSTGKYKVQALVGFLFMIAGTILFLFMESDISDNRLIFNLCVLGIGLGSTSPTFNIAVQNAFPQSMTGVVTGGVQFFRNMGSTIGSAIMGSVMLSRMKVHFEAAGAKLNDLSQGHLPGNALSVLKNPMALKDPKKLAEMKSALAPFPGMFGKVMLLIKNAFTGALHDVFFMAVVSAVLAIFFALLLKEIPLREDRQKEIAVID